MKYLIVTPNNINAAGIVINYWNTSVNNVVWMVIFIAFSMSTLGYCHCSL